ERHQRQETVVRNAENSDPAIAFRNILHQPIDGVISIGGMVHRGWVQGAVQGASHHIVALGAVLAAHVLDRPNVSSFDDDFSGVVIAIQDWAKVAAVSVTRQLLGIVGRAREQNRRMLCALWDKNDCVELYSITHRNHHFAPDVIEAIARYAKLCRSFAREVSVGSLRVRVLCPARHNHQQKRRGTCDSCNPIANRHGWSSFWKKLERLHYST